MNLLLYFLIFGALGGYAGRQEADQQGGHQIYDLFTEKTPFVYKKLFETTRGVLMSFNKTLAILVRTEFSDVNETNRWNDRTTRQKMILYRYGIYR